MATILVYDGLLQDKIIQTQSSRSCLRIHWTFGPVEN